MKYYDLFDLPPPRRRRKNDLDVAIVTLLSNTVPPFQKEKALFRFVSQLRWPVDYYHQDMAELIMLTRYACDKLCADDISLTDLKEHLNLSQAIEKFADPVKWQLPFLGVWDAKYSDTKLIAEVVRFLLAWEPRTKDRRKKPSLKKAHHLLQQGHFSCRKLSWRRFMTIWQDYKLLSFVHYVNQYHFTEKLLLDPGDKAFTSSVDGLLADPATMRIFFGQCSFVLTKMRTIVPHAWNKETPPQNFQKT